MSVSEARKELVRRAQQGDRVALTELMTEAVPVVSALVRGLAPGLRDREDVTQEVLLRAMSHLKAVRDPARFGAYLNEIARNLVYDLRRRGRLVGSLPEEPPSTESGPTEQVMRKEEGDRVRGALLALGGLDRQIVLLRHWTDASYEDIADTLGLTVSAVQSRLFRARRELRRRLGGKVDDRD